ncbi:dsDNA nuclease domain-containing protein [Clostridium gasigenes]|uniref:CD-NTase associated protein 4-like DNA endonuclease domain-containing protein n=1 Tax=Clostridium gasigenes TaxID=94869 RepID=A0A1H0LTJ4_9CLOT|nr:dsDNA nuclease domain-containing protein [Clostridium gasigenes]SDO71306.1 protein of unknown function [Clostridium gasigenes]
MGDNEEILPNISPKKIDIGSKIDNYKVIVDYLTKRKFMASELGGIAATRGFIYQYRALIHYCLECVESGEFIGVVSELGDDITLISEKNIKFIQVKSGKEGPYSKNLTPGILYKREKGLDSWVEKLFEQYDKFYKKTNNEDIDVEFVISYNCNLGDDMQKMITDEGKLIRDENGELVSKSKELRDKLNTVYEKIIDKKIVKIHFEESFCNKLDWYIERFSIDWLGHTDYLDRNIYSKIEKIYNVKSLNVKKVYI